MAAYHRMGETGILDEDDRGELLDGEIVESTTIEALPDLAIRVDEADGKTEASVPMTPGPVRG